MLLLRISRKYHDSNANTKRSGTRDYNALSTGKSWLPRSPADLVLVAYLDILLKTKTLRDLKNVGDFRGSKKKKVPKKYVVP